MLQLRVAHLTIAAKPIMDATPEQLNLRFPKPISPLPTVVTNPTRHAGWSHESTKAVLDCLKDNHHRFHIFFNDKGFHKCVSAPHVSV